jgi:hypothetical protein
MRPFATTAIAVMVSLATAGPVCAQQGGFGGVKGGGARATDGTTAGMNRAGTSSSGGFAYGDAPKAKEPGAPAAKSPPRPPCKGDPVDVSGVPHYKCGSKWYAEPRPGEGYARVKPPAGY